MKKLLTLVGAAIVLSSSFAMADNRDFIVESHQQDKAEYIQPLQMEQNNAEEKYYPRVGKNKARHQYDSSHYYDRKNDK